jgi:hypothetical protein
MIKHKNIEEIEELKVNIHCPITYLSRLREKANSN